MCLYLFLFAFVIIVGQILNFLDFIPSVQQAFAIGVFSFIIFSVKIFKAPDEDERKKWVYCAVMLATVLYILVSALHR